MFLPYSDWVACLDDQSSLGDRELSESLFPHLIHALTAYFGEEFVVKSFERGTIREELPLAYEWSYGTLNTDENGMASIRLKIHISSHDPELRYVFGNQLSGYEG